MSLAKVDCESCTIVSFDMSSMGLEAIAHECLVLPICLSSGMMIESWNFLLWTEN